MSYRSRFLHPCREYGLEFKKVPWGEYELHPLKWTHERYEVVGCKNKLVVYVNFLDITAPTWDVTQATWNDIEVMKRYIDVQEAVG